MLGGTRFVGRHFVDEALEAEHSITLIHRGQTGGDLFPECRHILMDRGEESAWASLPEGSWDAVVDFSAYVPRVMRYSAEALKGRAERYLFISTISVYDPAGQTTLDEDSPQLTPPAPDFETIMEAYGGLKVACERVMNETWGDKATIVRPGIIIGPYDYTDRFHHWVREISRDDNVDVPERLNQPVQYIDGRDLGQFCLALLNNGTPGVFNACGPREADTMGGMLGTIRATVNDDCFFSPRPLDELAKSPFALPDDGSSDPLFRCSAARGIAAGLTYRPLADTIRDIVAFGV